MNIEITYRTMYDAIVEGKMRFDVNTSTTHVDAPEKVVGVLNEILDPLEFRIETRDDLKKLEFWSSTAERLDDEKFERLKTYLNSRKDAFDDILRQFEENLKEARRKRWLHFIIRRALSKEADYLVLRDLDNNSEEHFVDAVVEIVVSLW